MTRDEAIALLKGGPDGVARWNAWRDSAPPPELPDLRYADLSGLDLCRVSLQKVDLTGAIFVGTDLRGAVFCEAVLALANLTSADLRGLPAFGSHPPDPDPAEPFPGTNGIDYANLTGANLTGANLTGANLTGADLSNAALTGTTTTAARLSGANLSGADLSKVQWAAAALRGANLHKANLDGAVLRGADLSYSRLNGWYDNADLSGADLSDADLQNVTLSAVTLSGADLDTAHVSGLTLIQCPAGAIKLNNCDCRLADLSGAGFETAGLGKLLRYKLASVFTWKTVRAVGALQVLTKASYVMLALVPILAGAWQGVRLWVGQSKSDVADAVKHIDRAADHRHAQLDKVTQQEFDQVRAAAAKLRSAIEQRERWHLGQTPKDAIESLKELEQALERRQAAFLKETSHDTGEIHKATKKLQEVLARDDLTPHLPVAWAVGFFAALFVVLGHLVYQLSCPDLVQQQTEDQFAKELLNGFSVEGPTAHERTDRLTRAVTALKDRADEVPTLRHPNLVRRYKRVMWIPSRVEWFGRPSPTGGEEGAAPNPAVDATGPGLMRIAIEEGAKAEYALESTKNRFWAVVALLLYAIAGGLIFWLTWSQSAAVLKATGWPAP